MEEQLICPICSSNDLLNLVTREKIPVLQNIVFLTEEQALEVKTGKFGLAICKRCGFVFNSLFQPENISYDQNYDNRVPSQIFKNYYQEIARYLYNKYHLENSLVVDIGCGKGTFLNILCSMFPSVTGLGIDPSFEHEGSEINENVKFIKDIFKPGQIKEQPRLVVCRHVLEHIENPVGFIDDIRKGLKDFEDTPIFIEVPSVEWIISSRTFWDFCYEHCNYFSEDSLEIVMSYAGYSKAKISRGFLGQYIWGEFEIAKGVVPEKTPIFEINSYLNYSKVEMSRITSARTALKVHKKKGKKIAIWGMATKGVMYTNLIDSDEVIIEFCIDINDKKWNKYIPHSGRRILPPEALQGLDDLVIVIMNTNYEKEIIDICKNINISAIFVDAYCNSL